MTTSKSYPTGTVTLSRLLGATGVKVSPAGTAPVAAAAVDGCPITNAVEAAAPVASTERRRTTVRRASPMCGLPDVFGSGWSQALPQRNVQVIRLREP